MRKQKKDLLDYLPSGFLLRLSFVCITIGLFIIPKVIDSLPEWLQRRIIKTDLTSVSEMDDKEELTSRDQLFIIFLIAPVALVLYIKDVIKGWFTLDCTNDIANRHQR